MKVDQHGNTTIIKNTQGKTNDFFQKFSKEHNSYKNQNLIVDLSHDSELTMEDVKLFKDLSKLHLKGKKSFILVADSINFNDVPSSLTLVPTILEAHDIIEMEEIERDLGF